MRSSAKAATNTRQRWNDAQAREHPRRTETRAVPLVARPGVVLDVLDTLACSEAIGKAIATMKLFQCLECRKTASVPYARSGDDRIMYCCCLNCGERMIVGDCHDDDQLMADSSDVWFVDECENRRR